MKNNIEMKEIYHSYKEKEVLKGISLTVKKGEIIEYGNPKDICRRHNTQEQFTIVLQNDETIILPNAPESGEEIGHVRWYVTTGCDRLYFLRGKRSGNASRTVHE